VRRWIVLAAALLVLPAAGAVAQKRPAAKKPAVKRPAATKPAPKLPAITPQELIDKHIEATGGREAYEKLTSTVMKGTLEVKAQGLSGTIEIYQKAPDKFLTVQSIGGVGEMRQGVDGETAWAKDPFTGVRTLEGVELATQRRAARFNAILHASELYDKMEITGQAMLDGRPQYVLKLTPKEGKPIVQWVDGKTFLITKTEMTTQGPQGEMTVVMRLMDYRPVDGVKVPFKTVGTMGGIVELTITVTDVKNNVPIEDSLFAKPAS